VSVFFKVLKEREALQDYRNITVFEIQQKAGFRNLLLEKKIEAISQDLEKTVSPLCVCWKEEEKRSETVQQTPYRKNILSFQESALSEIIASTDLAPEVSGFYFIIKFYRSIL
jgi:hypothetical protein